VARTAYRPAGLPKELGVGLEAAGSFAAEPASYPNGCHLCEVEIDPETGMVTVERYAAVDDVGKLINPLIVDGQIHGGLAQGFGQALMENAVFDRSGGQLLAGSFLDYGMAARVRHAVIQDRLQRGAVPHQSGRRQRGGRSRHVRRPAGDHERHSRCAAAAWRAAYRHAGDATPRLGSDSRRATLA